MNDKNLTELRKLQKVRGDLSAFSCHDEFLPWADEVPPLLEFDRPLYEKFIFWSKHVKSAYRMGRPHHDALGECIGIVNQAVKKLELAPTLFEEANSNKPIENLKYPEKVTLKWLYQHVPWGVWSGLLALLVASFTLGIGFSETQLYQSLKNDNQSVSSKTKT
ncbi:hypothetical protein [Vibrio crassostreae]|uniref:hypothetical protein n=1 Tax=Vibrio crassostreae TaxID=246167 RepID=UPI00104290BA|nr:hypothetical protein [Vibrio crassostreae]TCT64569.1 hypothetical protein EDB31_12710 [Vibrio crassostreae]